LFLYGNMQNQLAHLNYTSTQVLLNKRQIYGGAPKVNCCQTGNSWLTRQLADKPTRGQSSRGLDNSRTGQLADSEF